MKSAVSKKNCKFLGWHLGTAGVGARPQFSWRAYRRSQNAPAGAPAGYKIEGVGGDALRTNTVGLYTAYTMYYTISKYNIQRVPLEYSANTQQT
jgi:hypothetical protein